MKDMINLFLQGTTSLLVLLSMKPDYNDKIDIATLMAPMAFFKHLEPVQRKYLSSFLLFWVNIIDVIFFQDQI